VNTWYDEHGSGDPLVLLHGGLVDARFFEPNLAPLAERFHVYTPERRGHGHTPDVDGPITYQVMTDDTIAFLDRVLGGPLDLVGHSDGAFVAMNVAIQRPDLVNRLVLISGGFDKSGEVAPDVEFDVDEVVQFLGGAYGEVSPDGEEHFPVVVRKIGELMKNEPHLDRSELTSVRARTLVMFSDDDLVTLDHMVDMFEALPDPGEAAPGQRAAARLPHQRPGADRCADPPGAETGLTSSLRSRALRRTRSPVRDRPCPGRARCCRDGRARGARRSARAGARRAPGRSRSRRPDPVPAYP
jgi:pimeloyl-ACP methyl ester carboxylesterase